MFTQEAIFVHNLSDFCPQKKLYPLRRSGYSPYIRFTEP